MAQSRWGDVYLPGPGKSQTLINRAPGYDGFKGSLAHHFFVLALLALLIFIHAHILSRSRFLDSLALALVGGRCVGGIGGRISVESGRLIVLTHCGNKEEGI